MNVFDGLKMPKVVYDVESKVNGRIRVVEVGKTRKIIVDNLTQSMNPDSPACSKLIWGKLVDSLKKRLPEIESVLLLGLGGGTMAHLISRNYPEAQIVTVELDKEMINIAKKYFDIDSIPNLRVINEDALKVVVEPGENQILPGTFDVLIVDIYNGGNYPDLGKTGNFIAAVRRLVKSDGLVIFNRIYTKDHQDDVNSFIVGLEEFFGDVESEIVAGYTNSDNIIIFGKS